MNAFILAAGLGTRLKPWTLSHPKALVPVGGIPMLERVIVRLRSSGFDKIAVNVHHFSEQIVRFLADRDFGVEIYISDESDTLLDTGGALLRAYDWLSDSDEPFLIHNVDILSDADLGALMSDHMSSGAGATLLVSDRESSRQLAFDDAWSLRGWKNIVSGEVRPANVSMEGLTLRSFSGIHVMSQSVLAEMRSIERRKVFPVMDYYLNPLRHQLVSGHDCQGLGLIDIGKPETLSRANLLAGESGICF